jgi:hypothetical protein
MDMGFDLPRVGVPYTIDRVVKIPRKEVPYTIS